MKTTDMNIIKHFSQCSGFLVSISNEALLFSMKAFPFFPTHVELYFNRQPVFQVYYFCYTLISPELRERHQTQKNGGWGKGRRPEVIDLASHVPSATPTPWHLPCHTSRTLMLAPISLNYAWKWSNNSQREDYSENSTLMTQVPKFSSVLLSYRLKAYEDEVGVIFIHMQSTL